MRVAVTGGTGFVGQALTKRLLELGHEVLILTRSKPNHGHRKGLTYVTWLSEGCDTVNQLQQIDVMINLAGESINSGRWTTERKKRILESRLHATQEVLTILKQLEKKPKVFINASAIGFYGTSLSDTFTEESQPGNDFLATTVKRWEDMALQATELNIRTALCRFGIILDKNDGALPRMALPYKLFGGGTVGSGNQWMSWIHLKDVVEAMLFIMEHDSLSGPVNFTAPSPVKMKELGKTIAATLRRPHWIPAPAFALKIALGEMSLLVLEGQRVLPNKLQEAGYPFLFEQVDLALINIYRD
jgi:uncharacterized protein